MPVDVCNFLMENKSEMAAIVEPPAGFGNPGKNYYIMKEDHTGSQRKILFEVDTKYAPIKAIGSGSYGVVCSSNNRETDEKVAIKKISNVFGNEIDALRTLRELMLLRSVKHQNVVALKDVMKPVHTRSFKDVYLVYELMDTDLHRIIQSRQILSNEHCKYFLFQILRGLEYLHSANILHRDLKPGNLLVNSNCELKICDFGLARTSSKGKGEFMTQYVVTRWYRAPELLLECDNYGASIDVWSVGCILAEILGGEPIFPGTNTLSQLKLIMSVLGEQQEDDLEFIDKEEVKRLVRKSNFFTGRPFSALYPHADPLALDLLRRMLIFDPSQRITVAEALRHPYLSGMYDGQCSPPAPLPVELDIDEEMSEAMMREMMLREILYYHPEETPLVAMNECSSGSGPKSWLSTPVNNIVTC